MTAAEPERGYAAYLEGNLVLAFADGPGVFVAAGTGLPPLARHASLHGRLHVTGIEDDLREMLGHVRNCVELADALREGGLDVRPTPLSVMEWALR